LNIATPLVQPDTRETYADPLRRDPAGV